ALNAFDERFQPIFGKTGGRFFVFSRSSGRHRHLLEYATGAIATACREAFWIGRAQVKAGATSSTLFTCRLVIASVLIWTFRTPLSGPARLLSGISCATRHRAYRRRPRDSRPCSSRRLARRPLLSSSSIGNCGRSRPDSSCRYSARRCASEGV